MTDVPLPKEPERQARSLYLDSGGTYTVTFECNRCEDYRWRAVNPARNVRRGIKYLNQGDLEQARYFLGEALADLAYFATWEDEGAASSKEPA